MSLKQKNVKFMSKNSIQRTKEILTSPREKKQPDLHVRINELASASSGFYHSSSHYSQMSGSCAQTKTWKWVQHNQWGTVSNRVFLWNSKAWFVEDLYQTVLCVTVLYFFKVILQGAEGINWKGNWTESENDETGIKKLSHSESREQTHVMRVMTVRIYCIYLKFWWTSMCHILMDSSKAAFWSQVRGDIFKHGQHWDGFWNRMDGWEGLWKVRGRKEECWK